MSNDHDDDEEGTTSTSAQVVVEEEEGESESLKSGGSSDEGGLNGGYVDVGSTRTMETGVGGEFTELHVPVESRDREINSVMVENDGTDDENQFQDAAMFVDAPEELNLFDERNVEVPTETQREQSDKFLNEDFQIQGVEGKIELHRLMDEVAYLQNMVDTSTVEKETMACEHKEEKEMLMTEVTNLYHQLELMSNQQSNYLEKDNEFISSISGTETEHLGDKMVTTTLQVMIRDCSKFAMLLSNSLGEKLQYENTVKELHSIIYTKDQYMEDLGVKFNELLTAHDVAVSSLNSLQTSFSQEIHEYQSKEFDLMNKLNQIEDYNKSLMTTVEKQKESVLVLDAEVKKTKMELNQERARAANAKEKLGMAVTKGKALVQQRDSLKKALSEKTNEFEKCLNDLEEKSNLLKVAEINKEELISTQNLVTSFQDSLSQKEIILREIEETLLLVDTPEGFQSLDLVEKVRWLKDQKTALELALAEESNELEKCLVDLKEKSNALEAADLHKEEFVKTQILITSLQDSLSQKEIILKEIEESFVEVNTSGCDGFWLMNLVEKVRVFKDRRNALEQALTQKCNELEKCLVDLQEKSNALEEADANKEELVKCRSLISSLQESLSEKEVVLKQIEETFSQVDTPDDFLSLELAAKVGWLKDQRSTLEQALSEKRNEFEKYLANLQEKSNALEDTEVDREELIKNQNLTSSLQEPLAHKELLFEQIEEILPQVDNSDGHGIVDVVERIRLLKNEKSMLEAVAIEYDKLKDILSLLGVPETIRSYNLESKINWLWESFCNANNKVTELEGEISNAQMSVTSHESVLTEARSEIDRLTTSLVREKRDIDALRTNLDDVQLKYETTIEKEFRVSTEKDQMIKKFLEASGMEEDLQEPYSNIDTLVEQCITKIREQISASFVTSHVGTEQFETIQTSLYVKNQELALCNEVLKEATIEREKLLGLSDELKRVSQELLILTEERDSMRKDLEHSDEKYSLIREKLSMAVKKGKGLVQEREGLKNSLNEKSADIEKLNLELQQQETALTDCRDQISRLTNEKDSNSEKLMLELQQQETLVTEYKDQISRLSIDLQSIQKLESELTAMTVQKEQLEHFLLESNSMLQRVIEFIEGVALPVDTVFKEPVEKVKWISEQFHEYYVGQSSAEQELEEVKKEATSLGVKLEESRATIASLEATLSDAEKKISSLSEEAEAVHSSRSYIELELEKKEEEASSLGTKFEEACVTIKSLEETLSDSVKKLSVLMDGKNVLEIQKSSLENELENLKGEISLQAGQLAETHSTVDSLEQLLVQAEKNTSLLISEKEIAEKEILSLQAKLSAIEEDVAGNHGSLKNQFVKLFGHVNHFNILLKEDSLFSSMMQGFKKNFESLRNMSLVLESIQKKITQKGSFEDLQDSTGLEKDNDLENLLSEDIDGFPYGTVDTTDESATSLTALSSYFIKLAEQFEAKNKFLEDKFENCSSSLDDFIIVLLQPLQSTKDDIFAVLEKMESLKSEVKHLRNYKHSQESTISTLQHDINMLLMACSNAAKELQIEVNQSLDTSFDLENESLTHKLEKLKNVSLITIDSLQKKLVETRVSFQNAIEERDVNQQRIFELESDLEELQSICGELEQKAQDYQAKEDSLMEKDTELPSSKIEEADRYRLSDSEVKALFEKIQDMRIPGKKLYVEKQEIYSSAHVKKLFDIIDNVIEIQPQLEILSRKKEELQSSLDGYVIQTERFEGEAESAKNDLAELTLKLENFVQKLSGNNVVEDKKSIGFEGFLPLLESLVSALILEADTSKSVAQESVSKLEENQKIINELSTKVKVLEDTVKSKPALPNLVQERNIPESSAPIGSEISEFENAIPLGKKSKSPAPYAAQVRTLRKGSSDHLAINIDTESDLLINPRETDDDKGHVFKSLNTSGLVPVQGKHIADRVDGLWVSAGRNLMSRPRARIGLIAYWLFLHTWLLASIL